MVFSKSPPNVWHIKLSVSEELRFCNQTVPDTSKTYKISQKLPESDCSNQSRKSQIRNQLNLHKPSQLRNKKNSTECEVDDRVTHRAAQSSFSVNPLSFYKDVMMKMISFRCLLVRNSSSSTVNVQI